jgi:branched-chain amino acid transport system permease protein
VLGFTFAANRVLAFAAACVIGAAVWIVLERTRFGAALRALAIDPVGAQLVGIDVRRLSALAFGCGGALAATAGTLVSTFLSFNPAIGIEFTMKALVVVIMGASATCSAAWRRACCSASPRRSVPTMSIPD